MAVLGRVGRHTYLFSEEVGQGGETTIYRHPADRNAAARIFKNPADIDTGRIQEQIGNEPQPSHQGGFPCFGWAMDIITDPKTGHVVGEIVRFAPDAVPLSHIFIPGYRIPEISEAWLRQVARSLAYRVYTAEWHGYTIVDCNPENFMVGRQGIVCGVDCGSYQFKSKSGQLFKCQVGVPEFSAPEVLSALGSVVADRFSISWSLMVLTSMLWRGGEHPFNSANTAPPLLTRITQGLWPDSGKHVAYPPPRGIPPFDQLHPEFQRLLQRTFDEGFRERTKRPTSLEVLQAIERITGGNTAISIRRSAWLKQLPQVATAKRHGQKLRFTRKTVARAAALVAIAAGVGLAAKTLELSLPTRDTSQSAVISAPPNEAQVRSSNLRPTPRFWRELRDSD